MNSATMFAFFAVILIMAVLISLDYFGKKIFKHFGWMKTSKIAEIRSLNDDLSQLAAAWAETEQLTDTMEISLHNSVHKTKFLAELMLHFGVEVHSAICRMPGQCKYIIKLTGTAKTPIFIQMNTRVLDKLTDDENRNLVAATFPINEGDEYVSQLHLMYSNSLGEDHTDIINLNEAVVNSEIEFIQYRKERDNTIGVTRLMSNRHTGYALRDIRQNSFTYDLKTLMNRYAPVEFTFAGEKHKIQMDKAFPILLNSIRTGVNVLLHGTYGTGKTSLSTIMYNELRRKGVAPVVITASLLEEWVDTAKLAAAIDVLSMAFPPDTQIVFILDEAETVMKATPDGVHTDAQVVLLQMLSGNLQDTFNCSTIMISNIDERKMNQALFRAGRIGMSLELAPLGAKAARALCEEIRIGQPDLVFDQILFEKKLADANFLPNGVMYAGINTITLADVYSVFTQRDIRNQILEALRAASGKTPPKATRRVAKVEKAPVPVAESAPTIVEEAPAPAISMSEKPGKLTRAQKRKNFQARQQGKKNR